MRLLVVFLPLAFFVGVAGVFVFGLYRENPDDLPTALAGKPAPMFEMPSLRAGEGDLDRSMLTRPGFKVVNVWASWCGPCRVEHPELMTLAKDFPVYGLNFKDSVENGRAFLSELGDPFTAVGVDPQGRLAREWGVYGVPETYVVNPAGEIVYRHVGPIQNDDLERKILPLMR